MEEWRDIKGYEGIYQVSSYGRVRSLDHFCNGRHFKGCIRKQSLCIGYYTVTFYKHGESNQRVKVHRLVADAFIPNPNNHNQVNHKDENKLNNHVSNLEWCDAKYNSNFGTRTSRIVEKKNKPVRQYTKDGVFVAEYKSVKEASTKLGCDNSHIADVCRGGRKTAHGYVWRFVS